MLRPTNAHNAKICLRLQHENGKSYYGFEVKSPVFHFEKKIDRDLLL